MVVPFQLWMTSREFCEKEGIELQIVSPYSPWIAGLIENGTAIYLVSCANPGARVLGEDDYNKMQWEDLPRIGQYTSNTPSTYSTDV